MVYFKISPMKEVTRFGKKRKLSPWNLCLFEVLKLVRKDVYELRLPSELS